MKPHSFHSDYENISAAALKPEVNHTKSRASDS